MGFLSKRASSGDYQVGQGVWIRRAPSVGGFSPASLFLASEAGFWGEVTPTTTWQDTARTTHGVVDVAVASWQLTTSSGVIYATQATAGSRPILRQDGALYYLEFDGVDDALATTAVNLSATDALTICAGIRKASDAAAGYVIEPPAAGTSTFNIRAPAGASASYALVSAGSAAATASVTNALYAAPQTSVLTAQTKISTDTAILRRNGAQIATSPTDQGTGNYGNAAIHIGRRSSTANPFNGRIYGLVLRGVASAAGEVSDLETWMNARTGAF